MAAEKPALQRALLCLEERHGRPEHRRYRDLVRPLYERYRLVKRLAGKAASVGGGLHGGMLTGQTVESWMMFLERQGEGEGAVLC